MVTGSPAGLEHAQERFQESRVVRYDLTTPPSAEELGIDEGKVSAAFNREGPGYWRYELLLPSDRVFVSEGFGHRVSLDPQGGLGNGLVVNSRLSDIESADAALRLAEPVLGLAEDSITAWLREALAQRKRGEDDLVVSVIPGARLEYLSVSVEARVRGSGDVVLNWDFTW